MQSCTIESLSSIIGVAVSTAITMVIEEKIGGKMMSKSVKGTASQAVESLDIMPITTRKLINSDELMEPIARFVTKKAEKEACRVENLYKTEDNMAEIPPSPLSSKPSNSESSRCM